MRKIAAIMVADVVGYSRLAGADEDRTLSRLRGVRSDLIDPAIAAHNGRTVKRTGDGSLIEFRSVVDAVRCAIEVQNGMAERNAGVPPERRMEFRVGIHLGDVVEEGDGDLMGDGVNIAARLEQLCPPGGLVVSGTAYDQLLGKLDVPLEYLGEQQVKNISRPVRVYEVRLDGTRRRWSPPLRSLTRAAGLLAALLIAGVVLFWWSGRAEKPLTTPSLAVLPFENYGGSAADARLADGLVEDIITDLSRFHSLGVIARNSTEVYKGKPVDVRVVGKDLNVRYVLEGSLQRRDDRIRVSAQLVDTISGEHVWADRFDRSVDNVFAIQSEISDQVTSVLAGYIGVIKKAEIQAARRKRPADLGAFELYLLGLDASYRQSEAGLKEGVEYYKRALAADPTLSRAYSGLAHNYQLLSLPVSDPSELQRLQLESAIHAVELDQGDSFAHIMLGFAKGLQGDMKSAESELEEARHLAPNSFDVLSAYANWANSFGKGEAGAEAADQAIKLNPNYPSWNAHDFNYAFFMVGRNGDVMRSSSRLPEESFTPLDYVMVAGSLVALGRVQEAKQLVGRAIGRFPEVLVTERFISRPDYTVDFDRPRILDAMRTAEFPACVPEKAGVGGASSQQLVQLPECARKPEDVPAAPK
jgi:TolB-like protein/class 3 adenylate cyclase/tetratricopeptide (TPR) repeat protein